MRCCCRCCRDIQVVKVYWRPLSSLVVQVSTISISNKYFNNHDVFPFPKRPVLSLFARRVATRSDSSLTKCLVAMNFDTIPYSLLFLGEYLGHGEQGGSRLLARMWNHSGRWDATTPLHACTSMSAGGDV